DGLDSTAGLAREPTPEDVVLTPGIDSDDRPHLVIVRHHGHPRPPDDVENRQLRGSPERLDLGPARLADRLLDSARVLDGSGDDFAYGMNGRAFRDGRVALRLEAIQIEHRVTPVMRSTSRLSASPDGLPLRPGSRTGGVTDRDVFPRRHHGDEGGLKPLEQLALRIEVNEQTGLWPRLVADREAAPRITLEHGVRVIDLSADRVDADEEESARPQQRRDLLQIRPDVRVVTML